MKDLTGPGHTDRGTVCWTELHLSADNGETWRHTGLTWPGSHHGGLFQILTYEHGDNGYVYVCSTGFQRDKGLILQRVPAEGFTNPGAWQAWGYQDGEWAWGNPPALALTGKLGELCLRRDLHLIISQWNTTTNWPYRAMQFHTDLTG